MTLPLLVALALAAQAPTAQPPAAPARPRTEAPAAGAPSPASAPEETRRTLTLDDAVAAAVAHRPSLRASREAAAVAEAAAREARGALLPDVGIDARYAHARTLNAERVTDQGARETYAFSTDSTTAALTGDVLLWDFGRTANRWRSAKASAEAASDDARATEQGAVLEARVAYFGVLAAEALDEVAADALANAEKHLRDTEIMV
jgi:outer membrane protein TolC